MGGMVSIIVSYSRPSLLIIVSASQIHVYLPLGQRLISLISVLNVKEVLVDTFKQEEALVGAFSMNLKTSRNFA